MLPEMVHRAILLMNLKDQSYKTLPASKLLGTFQFLFKSDNNGHFTLRHTRVYARVSEWVGNPQVTLITTVAWEIPDNQTTSTSLAAFS
jgi:hypothetical protein